MSMPKRLSLLLLSISLFFTSACSDEAQLAEQCETQSSCETTTETKTNWASAGGIGAGVLALGALAGGGGGSSSSSGGSTSSGSSTETTDTSNNTDSSSTNSSSSTDATTDNKTAFIMKPTTEFCEDVCDGLVAYYPFFGNANDTSGNGNDLFVIGASLSKDRDGIDNHSYYFDGEDDLIFSNFLEISLVEYTISLVVKLDQTSPYFQPYLADGDWTEWSISNVIKLSNQDFQFSIAYHNYFSENKNNYELATVSKSMLADLQTQDDVRDYQNNPFQYHRISIVRSDENGLVYLYLNGEFRSVSQIENSITSNLNHIILGMQSDLSFAPQNRHGFNGWIDELRIYNRSLSESEIQQMIGN